MNNKNFDVYLDLGSSNIRAGAFSKTEPENSFQITKSCVSDFTIKNFNLLNAGPTIEEIILTLEKKSKEYIDKIDLMIDSPEFFSVSLSLSKNFDGSKLKKEDVQFLIQDAKQQILRNYQDIKIIHIIVQNYKIDKIDYDFLSTEVDCNTLCVDIIFICLPKKIVDELKKLFTKFNVLINQISFSSYAKSLSYRNNFTIDENIAFIDMGFNKTSIIYYNKNIIKFFNTIPVGGNHITKDISKILKIDLLKAEKVKLYFDKDQNFLNKNKLSLDLIQNIIFARVEEILELCDKSIKLNQVSHEIEQFKMVLMGEGSKILDNEFKEKISFSKVINLIEETNLGICESAVKVSQGINKREVVVVPKKQLKTGFFEKIFHFFN